MYASNPFSTVTRTIGSYLCCPRMYTMKVITYAPPANATPVITSKPIQRPHGWSCERLVIEPSPRVNRMTRSTALSNMIAPEITLKGVMSGRFGLSSWSMNFAKRRNSDRMGTVRA